MLAACADSTPRLPFDCRPLGRATLNPTLWDRLHSTPYGRFDRIVPPPPEANPYVSRVNFAHYDIARDPTSDAPWPSPLKKKHKKIYKH